MAPVGGRRPRAGRAPFGVAGRLAVLLGGLAAVSTGLALVLQDRALDQDLREAAVARLHNSATIADRLMAEHIRGLTTRWASISRTPELRANLSTRHAETLTFYAGRLLRDQGATMIAFLGVDGEILANAGDPRLLGPAQTRSLDRGDPRPACIETASATSRGPVGRSWRPCVYPDGPAEGSLFEAEGDLYAIVMVPLRTESRLDGGLIAVEEIDETLLADWSSLAGADIRSGEPAGGNALDALVRTLPGIEIRVSTTYDAEQGIIDRSRANLVISGVLALLLAVAASLLLARAFARPILRMREATERLSEGDLDHRVEVDRDDELGELGVAFNELASRLTASQDRLQRAQRQARFGNWYLDLESQAFDGSTEFRRLFRLPEAGTMAIDAVLGRVHPEDRIRLRSALDVAVGRRTGFQLDVRVADTDGSDRILHLRAHAGGLADTRLEGSVQDVTETREAEERIRYLSLHDALTGLGNRSFAIAELRRRVDESDEPAELTVAVIGIDDLRDVIDSFGHAVGDRILIDVARRLVGTVRDDPRLPGTGPDLVAKLGDDRFLVALAGVGPETTRAAAMRVLAVLQRPFVIGDEDVALTPSIGIARWPEDADDPETLLRNAETALGRVQTEEPGGVRLFHGSMHADASRRLRIANLLRRAIAEGRLELHYQPRVRPDTGDLLGLEALARWSDPELGPVSPGEFIPIAEATGSIHALGAWCLETAAAQMRTWHEAGYAWLSVSVNLSQHQLDPALVEHILSITEGLDRSRFELEVTESALIEEGDTAIETLTQLRAHGFRIALDDFGTGYSSLSYLQGLPLDTVKVDRAFIRDIAEDADAAALTASVLAMCRALRLHTVVEGVETAEQLATLVELGVTEAQGFLFCRPMPVDESTAYLGAATPAEPIGSPGADLPI